MPEFKNPPPSAFTEAKKAPFGSILGYAFGGIAVYSCYYENSSGPIDAKSVEEAEKSIVFFGSPRTLVYCGCKYQCVEFARRWMALVLGITFAGVEYASEIFDLSDVSDVRNGELMPWKSVVNGSEYLHRGSSCHIDQIRPSVGTILIWDKGGEFEHTGHVAVITEVVDSRRVRIAEQNVKHEIWPEGQNYSRELVLGTQVLQVSDDDSGNEHLCYTISDPDPTQKSGTKIKGWKVLPVGFRPNPIEVEIPRS